MDSVMESTDAKGNVLRGKGYCTQHKATNVYLKSVTIVSFISCGCNVFNSRLYFGEPMEWGSHKMSLGTASFTFLFVNNLNPRQISKHGLGFAKPF